jgi:2'-5' RNA ligase
VRLFVAVAVAAQVRAAVDAALVPARARHPELRWVDPANWHLTLVFLGNVADPVAGEVSAAVGTVCQDTAPLELALDARLGTFASGVLWAGLRPHPDLAALARGLVAALRDVTPLPDADREFRAHLTLARAGRGRRIPGGLATQVRLPAGSWTCDKVTLLQSLQSAARGNRYVRVAAWRLLASPA